MNFLFLFIIFFCWNLIWFWLIFFVLSVSSRIQRLTQKFSGMLFISPHALQLGEVSFENSPSLISEWTVLLLQNNQMRIIYVFFIFVDNFFGLKLYFFFIKKICFGCIFNDKATGKKCFRDAFQIISCSIDGWSFIWKIDRFTILMDCSLKL